MFCPKTFLGQLRIAIPTGMTVGAAIDHVGAQIREAVKAKRLTRKVTLQDIAEGVCVFLVEKTSEPQP